MEISKATIYGLAYSGASVVYDGDSYYLVVTSPENEDEVIRVAPSYTISIRPSTNTSFVESGSISYKVGEDDFVGAVHAGSYIITVTVQNDNYYDFVSTATLTVNKADMWAAVESDDLLRSFYFITEQDSIYSINYDTNTYFINVGYINATDIISDASYVLSLNIRPKDMALNQGLVLADTANITYLCDNSPFTGARNAGTYELKAIIHNANDDYNDITLTGTLIINKISFNGQIGNMPSVYLTGTTRIYDSVRHYVGVSYTADTYVDSAVLTLDLLSGDGVANVRYYFNTDGSEVYSTAFIGVINAGNYYVYAYTEITDETTANNYVMWSATAVLIIQKLDFIDSPGHLGSLYFVGATRTYDADTHYVGVSKVNEWSDALVSSLYYESVGLTVAINYTYYYDGVSMGAFVGTADAGVYVVSAAITETTNCKGYTAQATLTIEKLEFITGEGHLGELYFVGNSLLFDKLTHYLGVNSVEESLDSNVTHLSYFGNTLSIPVVYTYNTDNGEIFTAFSGASAVGTYYIKAEIVGTKNYEGWEGNAALTIGQLKFNDEAGQLGSLYMLDVELNYDTNTYYTGVSKSNIWTNSLTTSLNYILAGGNLNIAIVYTYTFNGGFSSTFSGALNAGTYLVTATISAPGDNSYEAWTHTAEIQINKAAYGEGSLAALYFRGTTIKYDMLSHVAYVSFADSYSTTELRSITLLGTDGAADVVYHYNTDGSSVYNNEFSGATNSRTYYLRASVVYDASDVNNYEAWERTATLTISPLEYVSGEIGDLKLNGGELVYNGEIHYTGVTEELTWLDENVPSISIELGANTLNIPINYYYNTDGSSIYTLPFNGKVNAGTYYIKASIDAEANGNYGAWSGETILKINKLKWNGQPSNLDTLYFVGNSGMLYDGDVHYVGISKTNAYVNAYVGYLYYNVSGEGITEGTAETADLTIQVIYKYYLGVSGTGNYVDDFSYAQDAGIYNIQARIVEGDNYEGWTAETTFTIHKLRWIDEDGNLGLLYFSGAEITYDATTHYMGVSRSDGVWVDEEIDLLAFSGMGINLSIPISYKFFMGETGTYTSEFIGAHNSGTYNVKATITETINYEGWTGTAQLIINKLLWNGQEGNLSQLYFRGASIYYDMLTHYVSVSVGSDVWNDSALNTLNYDINADGVTYLGATLGNLSIPVVYRYNTDGSTVYDSEFKGISNTGVVYLKASIAENENYVGFEATTVLTIDKLTFTNNLSGEIDVTTGNLGELFFVGNTVSYDMLSYTIGVNYENLYQNERRDTLTYTLAGGQLQIPIRYTYFEGESGEYNLDFNSATDAGKYNIKAYIEGNINYDGFVEYAVIQINKLSFTSGSLGELYFAGNTRPYDGYTHYMSVSKASSDYLDLAPQTLVYELSGGTLNIDVTYKYYMGSGLGEYNSVFVSATNAGIYNVRATIDGSLNYEGYLADATLTINKLTFTEGTIAEGNLGEIFFVGNTLNYDMGVHYMAVNYANAWQDSPRNTLVYTLPNLAELTIPISYTYYKGASGAYDTEFVSATNAGIYNVKAVIAENTNYEGFEGTATLTINKLSFTADSLGVLYFVGDTRPYDADTHYMSVSKTESTYTDTPPQTLEYVLTHGTLSLDVEYTYYLGSGVGEYSSVFVSATNAGIYNVKAKITGTENYDGYEQTAVLTINKLTFTAGDIEGGNLGLVYFVGNTMDYDMANHYVGISYTNAWKDSLTPSLSYTLPNESELIIPISYTYYLGESGTYSSEFSVALSAGKYNVKASVIGTVNYEGFDKYAVLQINKLSFSESSLGELYFVGNTRPYDGDTHYMSVSNT
ncbi:MAG: hypothetical protein EOM87_04065, partial [Clostridia bacterium]|nr:hypothetical protein [Clostridia bacterium]